MNNKIVKVNLKVTIGTFLKKLKKKQQFRHILKHNFVMFPEYIYKPFDIFSKIIIYKYYIPCAGDSRKYHPEECDYQPRLIIIF